MQSALTQLESPRTPDTADVDRASRTATVESIAPRTETHWTRILYVDLFDVGSNDEQQPARPTVETKTMRTSTELHRFPATDDAPAFEAPAPGGAPIVYLTREPASNDAMSTDPVATRDVLDAWTRHAGAANGFGGDPETVALTKPGATAMQQAARDYRSYALGEIIAALAMETVALLRDVHARWVQRREARKIHAAFRQLDDRMLHDLGLDRSEIGSLAAEVTGEARRTRMLALLTRNGFLM